MYKTGNFLHGGAGTNTSLLFFQESHVPYRYFALHLHARSHLPKAKVFLAKRTGKKR